MANGLTVVTYEDPSEVNDDNLSAPSTDPASSIEEMARDLLNVALEDSAAPQPVLRKPDSKVNKSLTDTTNNEFAAANIWIAEWRQSLSLKYKPRAFLFQLRAYALWHEQQHGILAVAAILREPPLKESTVAAYVLDALRLEGLPFNEARLVEVVECLSDVTKMKYRAFLKKNLKTEEIADRNQG